MFENQQCGGEMTFEQITLEVDGQVAVVTLNRPERLNTWTDIMSRELSEAMYSCDEDDNVRAIVITGAGRAFCAGADISGGDSAFAPRERVKQNRPPLWPYMVRKPVIAAINGAAIGVGITYPMLADVRLVAEQAKIGFAMVRRGILPELASHLTVAQVAGFSNAADLLLTGRIITGSVAVEMGLASECLPKDELMPRAMAIAQDIAANTAPVSVALSKKLLWEGLATKIPGMMLSEGKILQWLGTSADMKEGVQSFLEKRPPEWKMSVSKDIPEAF
ncbi:MAG: enoyl-CoA hydratase/carnithine racemase [Limisphaerales bacterium]